MKKIDKYTHRSAYLLRGHLQIWLNPSWKEFWFLKPDWDFYVSYRTKRWSMRIGRIIICFS